MSLEAVSVRKTFGKHKALDDVSVKIAGGELVALLGPSGGGKTTLLRVLAGLESPDAGVVRIRGEEVTRNGPHARGVGFVFQHYALFREMTVFENVAFGLRVKPRGTRPDEAAIQKRVHELLGLVQLEGLSGRHPDQLSGGQRQRVALARALAVEPKILLLDEPFGALDAKVRKELRSWLRRLHDELHVTTILVTHDQEEAFEIADRVLVIHEGRIHQDGTPEVLLTTPASPFVADFVSESAIVHGTLDDEGAIVLDEASRGSLGASKGARVALKKVHVAGAVPRGATHTSSLD
ncbi:MAG: sulfate ABC transporter ATP-binding protein [Deltaproteobacteria bacterium]|nr:sulfate ABC transporter ATP-binding protein [Deltaproteobacteria bacterium]